MTKIQKTVQEIGGGTVGKMPSLAAFQRAIFFHFVGTLNRHDKKDFGQQFVISLPWYSTFVSRYRSAAALRSTPRLADIAQAVGISTMTASRALNGHPSVTDETRRKVLAKAEELGYRPNQWARSLVTRRSMMIGLVVPDISHAFYAEITSGIQKSLERQDFYLLLCNSGRDPRTEMREIEALLRNRVEGLIVASNQREEDFEYFERLRSQGLPLVFVDRAFPSQRFTCLVTDDVEVGRLATEHLVALGHTRIAHVGGSNNSVGRLRAEGYRQFMLEHHLTPNPAWIVAGASSVESGREAARALMHSPDRPTAIFAASDYIAFGVVQACRAAGFRVPEDVSVVGAGDIEGDQHPNPFLSTVRWDRHEMGHQAAAALLELIQNPDQCRSKKIVFPPRLIHRHSSTHPR